jgi:hypothetical protein
MTKDELASILKSHAAWLRGEAGGQCANLSGADLRGANLSDANLSGADLSDAHLSRADLLRADLSDAHLSRADLRGANLRGANLSDANLSGANLRGANLSDANLSGADLSGAYGLPKRIPIIENIDAKILAAIEFGGTLNMGDWHTCETTHCRAGWAVTLAGDSGGLLEDILGTNAAATLIYNASRPGKRIPDFYASNEVAMASIKADAAGVRMSRWHRDNPEYMDDEA